MLNSTFFDIVQIILSVLIIILVLLQTKSSGLSTVFGGGSFQTTRRGSEKVLHVFTVVVVALFAIVSVLRLVLL